MDVKTVQKTFETSLTTIQEECRRQKMDDEFTQSLLDKFMKITVKYMKDQVDEMCQGITKHYIESRIQKLKKMCKDMGVDVTTMLYSLPVQMVEEISLYGIHEPSKLFEYADSILLAKQFQFFYLRNHLYATFQQEASTLGLVDPLILDTKMSLQHQCDYLHMNLHSLRSRSKSIDIILKEMWNQVKKIMETHNISLSIASFIIRNVFSKKECFLFLRALLKESSSYESFFHAFCYQINIYFTDWMDQQQLDPHLRSLFQELFSTMDTPYIAYKNRIETLIPTICVALMQCVTTNVTRVQASLQKLEIDALDSRFQDRVSLYLSRKASDYSIRDEYHLNEVYQTALKKNEEYKFVSMQRRKRTSCIEQLLSPSFISLGRSPEDVKMLLRTLLGYDKEILEFIRQIPHSCMDEVLPWISKKQFVCPVYSSNPFVSLIKEVLFIQKLL